MINSLVGGPFINVNNSGISSLPYISPSLNNPLTGMIRVNGNQFEAFNGSSWIMLPGADSSVGLDGSAISVLTWAQNKMEEERKVKILAETNVTIADAVAKIEEAQQQLKVLVTLTSETPTSEI